MNDLGHLLISLLKSFIRIISCVLSIKSNDIIPLATGFLIAEFLGIFEELVDKRK